MKRTRFQDAQAAIAAVTARDQLIQQFFLILNIFYGAKYTFTESDILSIYVSADEKTLYFRAANAIHYFAESIPVEYFAMTPGQLKSEYRRTRKTRKYA